jgi:hypothetical protein
VTGGTQAMQQFGEFINKQPLEKGTDILMLWRGSETLEVVVKPSGSVNLAQASPAPPLQELFSVDSVFGMSISMTGCGSCPKCFHLWHVGG